MRVGSESDFAITPPFPGRPGESASSRSTEKSKSQGSGAGSLTPEQQRQVDQLKARDQQVRTHEAAHMSAGAGLVTRGASFSYQQGPDGRRYATGGEVGLDASPVRNDPAATLMKAQRIQAAALAPADPSGQDRMVAAQAAAMATKAAAELATKRQQDMAKAFQPTDNRLGATLDQQA